jgi:hypothetical protein
MTLMGRGFWATGEFLYLIHARSFFVFLFLALLP